MDLFEQYNEQDVIKNNNKKTTKSSLPKIIIIAIVIILTIIIAIVGVMMYLKTLETKFYIDGSQKAINEAYFDISEDKSEIDISIQDMASLLNVEYYNGEYGKISEDTSKGYVSLEDEIVVFESNSDKIYKIDTSSNEEKYSYMYLDDKIKLSNGKLYTTPEGIMKILNCTFNYSDNVITINTTDYLYEYYTEKIADYGYKEISDEFANMKALKNGIIIAKKDDQKMGIIKTDGSEISGAKYTNITYIESTGDYIVQNNDKIGIINSQGKSKISLDYQEINVLDEDLGLFLVKQNDKYGVVNQSGNIVVYVEYDDIGIEETAFKDSKIKNPYLLFDNCIPVKKDNKWGIYNKSGKIILPIEYDSIGCIVGTSSSKSAGNAVIIEDYEAIVIGKDKLYGVINSTGNTLIPLALNVVYSVTSGGKTIYKIEGVQNGNEYSYDIEKYFDAVGIKKVNINDEESDSIEDLSENNTVSNEEENEDIENEEQEENEEESIEEDNYEE